MTNQAPRVQLNTQSKEGNFLTDTQISLSAQFKVGSKDILS